MVEMSPAKLDVTHLPCCSVVSARAAVVTATLIVLFFLSCASVMSDGGQPERKRVFQVYLLVHDLDLSKSADYDTPPELISFVRPISPAPIRNAPLEGKILLDVQIDERGDVGDVRELHEPGKIDLGRMAMAAVRRWKFKPATKEGKPIKVWITIPFHVEVHVAERSVVQENTASSVKIMGSQSTEHIPLDRSEEIQRVKSEEGSDEEIGSRTAFTLYDSFERQPPSVEQKHEEEGSFVPYDVPPELIIHTMKEPRYPNEAKKANIEGMVILKMLVDEKGNVVDVEVLKEDPENVGFGDAAMTAAKKWKFKPAYQEDKPVKVWISHVVRFTLD